MTDPLIDQLVADLEPRQPLVNLRLWMHCTACLALVSAAILASMGLRDDYLSAAQNGALFWKPGMFLLAWGGSILLIADLSRPSGRVKRWHVLPFVIAVFILIWQFVVQAAHMPFDAMRNSLFDGSAPYCLSVVLGGGSVTLAMAWMFWLSKTASPHPGLLGFLAGVCAGALAAAAYALHCDRDVALYVSVYYGLPVLGLGLLGSVLGKRLLRW